jgi:hypothetical protein
VPGRKLRSDASYRRRPGGSFAPHDPEWSEYPWQAVAITSAVEVRGRQACASSKERHQRIRSSMQRRQPRACPTWILRAFTAIAKRWHRTDFNNPAGGALVRGIRAVYRGSQPLCVLGPGRVAGVVPWLEATRAVMLPQSAASLPLSQEGENASVPEQRRLSQ